MINTQKQGDLLDSEKKIIVSESREEDQEDDIIWEEDSLSDGESDDKVNDDKDSDDKDDEKPGIEQCSVCHRTPDQGANLIHMPNGMSICTDCMQKSFDSFSQGSFGNGIQFLDLTNMDFNKLANMNIGDLLSGNLTAGKPKPKKSKKKKKKKKKQVESLT